MSKKITSIEDRVQCWGPESVCSATIGNKELAIAERICSLPTVKAPVQLLPESRYDKPGTLSGLAFYTEGENAHIFPGLVPDVGCGYHLILIKGIPSDFGDWERIAKLFINVAGVYSPSRRNQIAQLSMVDILREGVLSLSKMGIGLASINNQQDSNALVSEISQDAQLWAHEAFGCFLGHFLELRRVEEILDFNLAKQLEIGKADCLLIVHAGSQGLHRVLQNELHSKFYKKGEHGPLYGAPVNSVEGRFRWQAVLAAQNYARASRFMSAKLLTDALMNFFTDAKVYLLSDIFHSQIRVGSKLDKVEHLRGVQVVSEGSNLYNTGNLSLLLAGTKVTPSYLVAGINSMTRNDGHICHGTPEEFYATIDTSSLQNAEICQPAYADTLNETSHWKEHVVCTDLLLKFFLDHGIVRPVCRLQPQINLQKADSCL